MVFFENADGRVCIVFPYLGKVLAGSTDIRVETAGRVRCEPEERDYILDAVRLVFPGIRLSPDDVVFSYSGIRPLPRSDHEFTGRISRGHFVHRLDGPVPNFAWWAAKWTTFRAFAEQTADAVLAELGRQRVRGHAGARPLAAAPGFRSLPRTSNGPLRPPRDQPRSRCPPRRCLRHSRGGGPRLLPEPGRRRASGPGLPRHRGRNRLPHPARIRRRARRPIAAPHVAGDQRRCFDRPHPPDRRDRRRRTRRETTPVPDARPKPSSKNSTNIMASRGRCLSNEPAKGV